MIELIQAEQNALEQLLINNRRARSLMERKPPYIPQGYLDDTTVSALEKVLNICDPRLTAATTPPGE